MSGASDNVSGDSRGSSSSQRRSVVGVPKECWCGEQILTLMSKSENNPYRRYFRCGYATSNKLKNDSHVFKWLDEAMLNEIETLKIRTARLEQGLHEMREEREEFEKKWFEKVQMKVETEILEKVEDMLVEAKWSMKKTMILVVIGCMILIGCVKVLG